MSESLNNVTTADGYTSANTLTCEGSTSQQVFVTGAAVYYEEAKRDIGYAGQAVPFESEVFLPPGYYNWSRPMERFRVRSAVPGKPAQVTINTQP